MKITKAKGIRNAKIGPTVADRLANLEQAARNAPLEAGRGPRFNTRVSLTIVSYRVRLTDSDGCSAKAAIDGLVLAGVIANDSPRYVEEVRYRQIKVARKEQEKTEIVIEAVQ